MKLGKVLLATCLLSACSLLHAQAPAGATGQCKDGTYSTAKSKSGACAGHKGVQTWYSAAAAPGPATASAAPAPTSAAPSTAVRNTPAPSPAPAPARAAAPAPAPAPAARQSPAPTASQPAPGGGPGQVWVNNSTKVYHCSGDRYYGKTKNGTYMSESDAVAKGVRPDGGKPCPK